VGDVLACLQSGSLTSPECQKVLAMPEKLLKLREECAKQENEDKAVCKQLALLPGLPTADSSLPIPLPTLSTLLPSIPGLPRAPVGAQDDDRPQALDFGKRGPTMRQLMALYDPALVSLLVPGLVLDE
jgi:phospholipid/cholesterol/gamma-HCH transport system substrate-binding protein